MAAVRDAASGSARARPEPARPAGAGAAVGPRPIGAGARAASLLLDLGYLLLLPILLPWILYLVAVRRRGLGSLRERLGYHALSPLPSGPRIWIHCVSVGELEAALPLIRELEAGAPHPEVAVTVTTEQAYRLARERLGARPLSYFPIDFGCCVRRVIARLRPALVVSMELELWPNLVLNLAASAVPFVVANGRVSERGARRMRRARFLLSPFLGRVSRFLAQSEEHRARLEALGVRAERLEVTGNLKFDRDEAADPAAARAELEGEFGLEPGGRRWIAGCTHAGEEEMLVAVHRRLAAALPGLGLILAPRHVERAAEVERVVRSAGLRARLASRGAPPGEAPAEVVILDVTGQLARLYAAADAAFVGGSLVPRGGHNLLEPVLAGTPVVHGPHTENFAEIAALLRDGGASREIAREEELEATLHAWLESPAERRARVERGRALVAPHRGAAARSAARILALIGAVGG